MIRPRPFLLLTLFIILLLSLLPSDSQAETSSVILPVSKVKSTRGNHSNQPLDALAIQDQSGEQNDWNKYVEFSTAKSGYIGYLTFDLSPEIDPATITAVTLNTNYLGQTVEFQRWLWQLRDYANKSWVTLGDNSGAGDWVWSAFSFDAPAGDLNRFVSSSGELKVRYKTTSGYDDSDLDYLVLVVETSGGTPAPPTPTNTPVPTSTTQPTNTPLPTSTPTPVNTPLPTNTPVPTATLDPTGTPEPGNIWQPPPGTSYHWQLQGDIDTTIDVDMVDIDLFDTPQSLIDQLQDDGRVVICYFSAGSWENWRPDAADFPRAVKGKNNGWPGEKWLDIRQLDILGPIMATRLDLAAQKGCDGVEPDNVDGYSNRSGFPLSYQDQLTYNTWLADQAHQRDLSVGLKNDVAQAADLQPYFDWALNEQCFQYNECHLLLPFVQAGKAVFGAEYKGDPADFCPTANQLGYSWLKLDQDLDGSLRIDCLAEYP